MKILLSFILIGLCFSSDAQTLDSLYYLSIEKHLEWRDSISGIKSYNIKLDEKKEKHSLPDKIGSYEVNYLSFKEIKRKGRRSNLPVLFIRDFIVIDDKLIVSITLYITERRRGKLLLARNDSVSYEYPR